MLYYEYDEQNYLVGTHDDTTRTRSTDIAPPPEIPLPHARWDGSQWVADPSRELAEQLRKAREAAVNAVQKRIDEQARAWGYDDIKSAATYADDPDAQFAAEGLALRNWRSATWAAVRDHQDSVTTEEELFALLPPPPTRPVVA
jgi:hypothetical protein